MKAISRPVSDTQVRLSSQVSVELERVLQTEADREGCSTSELLRHRIGEMEHFARAGVRNR